MKRWMSSVTLVSCITGALFGQPPRIRISAWYWLNSAPKVDWQGDFITMRNLGFTDVLLCWGIDLAGAALRTRDTRQAMEWAHQAGLGAYIVVWQPTANSLGRHPEFMQVDSAGHYLYSFDVFNRAWRDEEWKPYLQKIVRAYRNEPAMAGYVFDDSFLEGPVGGMDGRSGTGTISYNRYEKHQFGTPLPRKPGDPRWSEWTRARERWWEDWARDTTGAIRALDPNPQHEIYLEDPAEDALNPDRRNTIGLDFARVARYFDAVGAYTAYTWTSSPDSGERGAAHARDVLARLRKVVDPKKMSIYTFWVANPAEEFTTIPAKYPTADQIRLICQAAIRAGIHHLDMYGYRIGDYRATALTLPKLTPGSGPTYPLTGQFVGKFLWDRPDIHGALATYLHSLNGRQHSKYTSN